MPPPRRGPVHDRPAHGDRSRPGGAAREHPVGPEQQLAGRPVTEGGRSLLLAGDAEEEEQQTLLGDPLRVDVLKVAHHGSAFQDPAFLARVRPTLALVSVGRGNPYGHPNAGVLSELSRGGATVLRTDQGGDLAAVDDGGRLAVAARGDPRPPP